MKKNSKEFKFWSFLWASVWWIIYIIIWGYYYLSPNRCAKLTHLGPWWTCLSIFECGLDFAEIFVSKVGFFTLQCHWLRGVKNLGVVNQILKTFFCKSNFAMFHVYLFLTDYPFKSYQRPWKKNLLWLHSVTDTAELACFFSFFIAEQYFQILKPRHKNDLENINGI